MAACVLDSCGLQGRRRNCSVCIPSRSHMRTVLRDGATTLVFMHCTATSAFCGLLFPRCDTTTRLPAPMQAMRLPQLLHLSAPSDDDDDPAPPHSTSTVYFREGMPPGWAFATCKDTSRVHYLNVQTKATTWELPSRRVVRAKGPKGKNIASEEKRKTKKLKSSDPKRKGRRGRGRGGVRRDGRGLPRKPKPSPVASTKKLKPPACTHERVGTGRSPELVKITGNTANPPPAAEANAGANSEGLIEPRGANSPLTETLRGSHSRPPSRMCFRVCLESDVEGRGKRHLKLFNASLEQRRMMACYISTHRLTRLTVQCSLWACGVCGVCGVCGSCGIPREIRLTLLSRNPRRSAAETGLCRSLVCSSNVARRVVALHRSHPPNRPSRRSTRV